MEEYEGLELRAVLAMIWRWLWLIVLGTVLAGGTALIVSFIMPPVYQAEVSVVVMRSRVELTFEPRFTTVEEAVAGNLMNTQDRMKALTALVKNSAIASQVIEELGPTLSPEERKAQSLLEMVETETDGDLIKIQVEADSPQKAAAIANAWGRAYEERVNRLYGENSLTADDVQAQAAEAEQSYQQAEEALAQFLGDNQIDVLSREITAKENTLADYYAAKLRLERLIADGKALQEELRGGIPGSPAATRNAVSMLLLKANASVLSSGLPAELQFSFDQMATSAEDPAEQLSELETLIANLDTRRTEVEQLIEDSPLQQEILQLEEQLEREQAEKKQLVSIRDLIWGTYRTLSNKAAEVEVAAQMKESEVRFAVPAVEPEHPVRPRKMLNTLLASVVGAVLAVAVVFLIEYLDDTVRTPEDVRRTLGVAPLSAIAPLPADVEWGLVALAEPRSPAAESFRALRTQLQVVTDKSQGSLLVTSPEPLEGKSTVAANLGTVVAQAGRSVIVVDADLRRPVLHEIFELSNVRGLSNALSGDGSDLNSYIQPTRVENLRVLTSGALPPNPTELLGSPRMEALIQELKGQADVVLFDSPAALALTDAVLLAKQVDGVLLVVKAGATRRGAARQAVENLAKVRADLLGVILNRFAAGAAGYYYGTPRTSR